MDIGTLGNWLWEAACSVRGPLDAPKYKDYILPLLFYKRLCDVAEDELGRLRTEDKNAPRTIDLDISLFGDQVLALGDRHIPDPDILGFAHVARPLADLAPEVRHPETGQTLAQIAESLSDEGLRRRDDVVLGPGSQSAMEDK